jgi:hypothetical protein
MRARMNPGPDRLDVPVQTIEVVLVLGHEGRPLGLLPFIPLPTSRITNPSFQ